MDGLMVILLYIACLFFGFCGGLLGCLYFKRVEKRKAEKHEGETLIVNC